MLDVGGCALGRLGRGAAGSTTRIASGGADVPGDVSLALGRWHATVLSWRPKQLALFVHDTSLLPVMMPLAPAATVLARFPGRLAGILELHGVGRTVIEREIAAMTPWCLTATANRSVVGVMNEFVYLAAAWRDPDRHGDVDELSMRLAQVPCGPLYKRHVSPDRELASVLAQAQPSR